MKNLVPIILILLAFGCKQAEIPVQVQKNIDSIIFKHVPDKREGICDINLNLLKGHKLLIKGETSVPEAKNEILKYLSNSGIEYYDSLKILPDISEISKTWGLVSVCICNIKEDPSHSSELISQAIMGTPVKILKKNGSWLLVQTPDRYIGWASDSGINERDEKEFDMWKKSERLIFTRKSGDIFSEANGVEVVSDAVAGVILTLRSEMGDYYLVELPDGRRGRVGKNDAEIFNNWCSRVKPEADKLISFAKSLTGTSYLWGGTSTKMADCSGFVKIIYFMGGVILARDASQQFLHGQKVDISSSLEVLKPGDLLFFGSVGEMGEERITHTGMYIGNNEFIHSSGMIKVNSFDSARSNYSDYLLKIMRGARRIIGTEPVKGMESIAQHHWYR